MSKVDFEEVTDTFPSEKESGVRLCLDVVPALQQQDILVLFAL